MFHILQINIHVPAFLNNYRWTICKHACWYVLKMNSITSVHSGLTSLTELSQHRNSFQSGHPLWINSVTR